MTRPIATTCSLAAHTAITWIHCSLAKLHGLLRNSVWRVRTAYRDTVTLRLIATTSVFCLSHDLLNNSNLIRQCRGASSQDTTVVVARISPIAPPVAHPVGLLQKRSTSAAPNSPQVNDQFHYCIYIHTVQAIHLYVVTLLYKRNCLQAFHQTIGDWSVGNTGNQIPIGQGSQQSSSTCLAKQIFHFLQNSTVQLYITLTVHCTVRLFCSVPVLFSIRVCTRANKNL